MVASWVLYILVMTTTGGVTVNSQPGFQTEAACMTAGEIAAAEINQTAPGWTRGRVWCVNQKGDNTK